MTFSASPLGLRAGVITALLASKPQKLACQLPQGSVPAQIEFTAERIAGYN